MSRYLATKATLNKNESEASLVIRCAPLSKKHDVTFYDVTIVGSSLALGKVQALILKEKSFYLREDMITVVEDGKSFYTLKSQNPIELKSVKKPGREIEGLEP